MQFLEEVFNLILQFSKTEYIIKNWRQMNTVLDTLYDIA